MHFRKSNKTITELFSPMCESIPSQFRPPVGQASAGGAGFSLPSPKSQPVPASPAGWGGLSAAPPPSHSPFNPAPPVTQTSACVPASSDSKIHKNESAPIAVLNLKTIISQLNPTNCIFKPTGTPFPGVTA
jgi:hypothetical protein